MSLKVLMEELQLEPFEFYERFSEFFYESGYQHRSHKKEDLYRIMNKFAESENLGQRIKECLGQDLEATMNFDAVKKFYRKGWNI